MFKTEQIYNAVKQILGKFYRRKV